MNPSAKMKATMEAKVVKFLLLKYVPPWVYVRWGFMTFGGFTKCHYGFTKDTEGCFSIKTD